MDYARYVVQAGDTIYKIAKAYQLDMTEIIQLNHLKHPDLIYPGQVLLLPVMDQTDSYPVEIPEPNFTYATWLFDAYAGSDSELTAITTYLYQAVVLDRPEFDALWRPIAYDELRHLEQLAIALRFLGVDPRYGAFKKGRWVDWRSRNVNYTTDLCSMLDMNMEDEAKAHLHYMELAEKIPIPEIQQILMQMATDEQRHYQCFAEAKQQFCGIMVPPPPYPPEYAPEPIPEPAPEFPGPPPEEMG